MLSYTEILSVFRTFDWVHEILPLLSSEGWGFGSKQSFVCVFYYVHFQMFINCQLNMKMRSPLVFDEKSLKCGSSRIFDPSNDRAEESWRSWLTEGLKYSDEMWRGSYCKNLVQTKIISALGGEDRDCQQIWYGNAWIWSRNACSHWDFEKKFMKRGK